MPVLPAEKLADAVLLVAQCGGLLSLKAVWRSTGAPKLQIITKIRGSVSAKVCSQNLRTFVLLPTTTTYYYK